MSKIKNILVVGATGGTGFAAIEELLAKGFHVTAYARSPQKLEKFAGRIKVVQGDIFNAQQLSEAVQGQDAVIVSLGISENPIRVRLLGTRYTPMNVRSAGTEQVIAAMKQHGVKKLIVQSTFGVGNSRDKLRFIDSLFFKVLLKPQIADTERQERLVKASGLNWVLAQPVHLRNDQVEEEMFASSEGDTKKASIARRTVARFLIQAVASERYLGKSVALSAA